jgi:hypothetical protein
VYVLWLQALLQAGVALYLGVAMVASAVEVPSLGGEGDGGWVFLLLTLSLLIAAGCARIARDGREVQGSPARLLPAAVVWAGVGLVLAGGASAAVHSDPVACGLFKFDGDRWQEVMQEGTIDESAAEDRRRIAATLVNCDTLSGDDRGEVGEMLGTARGRHGPESGSYRFELPGESDSSSDPVALVVSFDRSGKVDRAYLDYADVSD